MNTVRTVAEEVAILLGAQLEADEGQYVFRKERTVSFTVEGVPFSCTLWLNISFEDFQTNGIALNKAEIVLETEECLKFQLELIRHEIPLPTTYRQWQVENPNITCIYIESYEAPLHFAERLSAVLNAVS